jgi:hypothetical protein
MSELTLESLARRLEEVERRLNEKETDRVKDWRKVAGMFTGREFSKAVDEEGRKVREADREAAARNSESDPSRYRSSDRPEIHG